MRGRKPGSPRTPGCGRKAGTPNKRTTIKQALLEIGDMPIRVLKAVAEGDLPCGTCRGSGRTKFQPRSKDSDEPGERTCQSCWGSGKERITTTQRTDAAKEILQYQEPKRKALEVTGADGGPVSIKVTYVE